MIVENVYPGVSSLGREVRFTPTRSGSSYNIPVVAARNNIVAPAIESNNTQSRLVPGHALHYLKERKGSTTQESYNSGTQVSLAKKQFSFSKIENERLSLCSVCYKSI